MLALEKMCTQYFNLKPLIIGDEDVDPCLNIRYPNTAEIGADRIVNAVGAIKKYGAPLIIIDFGTATTYCYIKDRKSTRLNSSHVSISYAVFCLKKKINK